MSHKIVTQVYAKRIGSGTRKAVMAYFADRASDNGKGIWASKGTIAKELEIHRTTIIRVCNSLEIDGLIVAVGEKPCANGSTVIYDIDLEALGALPSIGEKPKVSHSATGSECDQSQSATPPVAQRYPKVSHSATQTVLKPSMNQDAKASIGSTTPFSQKDFDDFWDAFPHRGGIKKKKPDAITAFKKALKSGATIQQIADGVNAMRRDPAVSEGFGRGPVPWLNQQGWTDEIPELEQTNGGHHGSFTSKNQFSANSSATGIGGDQSAAFAAVAAKRSGIPR